MKNLIFLLAFASLMLFSCKQDRDEPAGLTIARFKREVKPDMTYTAMVSAFGAPVNDRGSGIHIYVFPIADGTAVWVGYTDRILYARHMDRNNQLIEELI